MILITAILAPSELTEHKNAILLPFLWISTQRKSMAHRTSRGRAQDRKRVAACQDYEVRYEAKKAGTSKGDYFGDRD